MTNLTTQSLVEYLNDRPGGVSSGEIESHFDVSRSTLIRRLKEAMRAGTITVTGKGPATRYFSADPLSALKAYFAKAHTERVVAPYREERLAPSPGLSDEATLKFKDIARHRLGKRELGKFLIDFACASSVLEGGTYSLLDTQALIEYGEKSGKPLEDAFLVLKQADVTSDLQRSADPRRPAPDLLRRFRETGLHRVAAGVLRARRHPPCRALPRRGLHQIGPSLVLAHDR
jgi:Fic family protein